MPSLKPVVIYGLCYGAVRHLTCIHQEVKMSVFPPAITQMKVSFHAHYSAETQRKPKRAANLFLVALHALQANFNRRIIGRLFRQ